MTNTQIQIECIFTIILMLIVYFREKRLVAKDTEHLLFHKGILWFMRICIAVATLVFIESVIVLEFRY